MGVASCQLPVPLTQGHVKLILSPYGLRLPVFSINSTRVALAEFN
jgi:hypothetical protein